MSSSQYRYLGIITVLSVTVLIASNVASSAKIVDLGFSLFGIPMAFDGGAFIFPLSYILGDIVTEVYGFKSSRKVIWKGFAAMALFSVIFFILQRLPGEAEWEGYAGSAAYSAILGGISSGGITIASLTAYLVGEFTNAMTLSRIKVAMKGKLLWVRTIASTLIGQLLDTVIFVTIATLLGVFPWELFMTLVLTNYIFKCLTEAVLTPATYLTVKKLKKAENADVYDKDISFNPFKFKL